MIKKEKYFFITLLFLIVIFCALIFLNILKSNEITDILEEINYIEEKINKTSEILFLDSSLEADLIVAKIEFNALLDSIKKQRSIWAEFVDKSVNISQAHEPTKPSNVNANLVRLYSFLSARCKDNGVLLTKQVSRSILDTNTPDRASEFGFGFSSYSGFWPSFSQSEANTLDIQSKIIKQMVDALVTSTTQNQFIELNYIKREAVGPTDKKYIGSDLLELPSNNFLLRREGYIESMCFEISFTGRTENARSFINQLAPPFSVRKFIVNRIEEINESISFEDPIDMSKGDSIIPIIRDIKSSFVIHLEYLTNVHFHARKIVDISEFTDSDSIILKELHDAF